MSMSLLQNYLTQQRFFYQRNSRHATHTYGLDNNLLYNNHPRFPFEFYIQINLNNVGGAKKYISGFYNTPMWEQVHPLVKMVEMPNIKIETIAKNQYNRKRISQSKINFEPVKMVFHDVADGKTLKFWEMYYRYYFGDGNEPGVNIAREVDNSATMENQRAIDLIQQVSAGAGPINAAITGERNTTNTSMVGDKRNLMNITKNTLDNHLFGYNLSKVGNIKNLISSIDIYQIHAGRFNQVTLVNPRISAFSHDTLNYSESSKTLEISLTFEYEYAYYTIQNMQLGGNETHNSSSLEPFSNGQQLEIPAISFTATLNDYVESNNPILTPESAAILNGRNVQSSLDSVNQAFPAFQDINRVSSSVLDGIVDIGRAARSAVSINSGLTGQLNTAISKLDRQIQSRTFQSSAVREIRDRIFYKGLG